MFTLPTFNLVAHSLANPGAVVAVHTSLMLPVLAFRLHGYERCIAADNAWPPCGKIHLGLVPVATGHSGRQHDPAGARMKRRRRRCLRKIKVVRARVTAQIRPGLYPKHPFPWTYTRNEPLSIPDLFLSRHYALHVNKHPACASTASPRRNVVLRRGGPDYDRCPRLLDAVHPAHRLLCGMAHPWKETAQEGTPRKPSTCNRSYDLLILLD